MARADRQGHRQGRALPLVKNHVIQFIWWWGWRGQDREQDFEVEVQPELAECYDSGWPVLTSCTREEGILLNKCTSKQGVSAGCIQVRVGSKGRITGGIGGSGIHKRFLFLSTKRPKKQDCFHQPILVPLSKPNSLLPKAMWSSKQRRPSSPNSQVQEMGQLAKSSSAHICHASQVSEVH